MLADAGLDACATDAFREDCFAVFDFESAAVDGEDTDARVLPPARRSMRVPVRICVDAFTRKRTTTKKEEQKGEEPMI